ncbi:MAG: peptide chain release factor N(5)-glutamine methyltransferase [Hyphomicrobiaceae bacterium]
MSKLTNDMPSPLSAQTAGAAVREIAAELASRGFESPSLDARFLIESVTGETREALALNPQRALTSDERETISAHLARRLAHEPVSRILGRRAFYGREFEVSPATLDPRPETETLVEVALEIVQARGMSARPIRILDIGTGTGCLLLTLLAELPMASGLGTDPSAAALSVAEANAKRMALEPRAQWLKTDGLTGVSGPFDLAVANPPYIPSGEIGTLPPAVRDFDPHLALDGGADGLSVFRQIVSAARLVIPAGFVVLEVGAGQAEGVMDVIRQHSNARECGNIETRNDLSGHTRCVIWMTH